MVGVSWRLYGAGAGGPGGVVNQWSLAYILRGGVRRRVYLGGYPMFDLIRRKSGDSPRKRRIGRIRSKLRCAPEVQARQPSPHPPPFISHFFQHKNTPHLFASACCHACTNKWGAVPSGILFLVGVYPVCEGNQARTTRTPDGVSSSRMPRLLSSSRIRSASA